MAVLEPRLSNLLTETAGDQLLDVVATLRRPVERPAEVTPQALAEFRRKVAASGEILARAVLDAIESRTGLQASDITLFGGMGSVRLLAPAAFVEALADDDRVETVALNESA